MDTIAVEKNETTDLIENMSTYGTEMLKSLDEMSKTISLLLSSFQGEVGDSIKNKFSEYEDNFPKIRENISSYIQDFKNLITSFENEDGNVSTGEISNAVEGGELINVRNQI